MADPSERAGLTDAPLSVAIAKWIATSVSGIASAASAGVALGRGEDHREEAGRRDDLDDQGADVADALAGGRDARRDRLPG